MNKWIRVLCGLVLSFGCVFISLGYAALSDTLHVSGTADATAPVGLYITEITHISGPDLHADSVYPTNMSATITGARGETAVYQITVYNNTSNTYIYSGTAVSDVYADVQRKVEITASSDRGNTNQFSTTVAANYVSGVTLQEIGPQETYTFYTTYTLTDNVTAGNIMVNYQFVPFYYSVTYLSDNQTYAVDYITDNNITYDVRTTGPGKDGQKFAGWVNASLTHVTSYPPLNTSDYTLSATWENTYLIMFVDHRGNVLYQETFTDSTKKNGLSSAGQEIVNTILAELAAEAAKDNLSTAWSEYNMASATGDITVHPVYTYTGNLQFEPVDENADGITDYYKVIAVDVLDSYTYIPGRIDFLDMDIRIVEKLYKNEDNFDYSAGVTTIEVGEGVTQLEHNSFAYTADLKTVKLPSTLTYIGKNTFSRNFGNDKKVLTIEFNGTIAQWHAINKHEEWDNGLKVDSKIICSDGYIQKTKERFEFIVTRPSEWKDYPN